MIHNLLKKVYLRLPRKLAQFMKDFYYNELERIKWAPRNAFVSFIRPFVRNKKVRNINFFEQSFNSQFGEDGIIRTILDKIGTTNKICVEFGIHAHQGNTIRLKKRGWKCLWMDGGGDGKLIKKEFITAENIENLFKKYKVPKEFDILSIDIDSNDYWVWKAINNYSPRVIVIEYNAHFPPPESKTVKYDPKLIWDGTNYLGASLSAMNKLGQSKGYTLVGCCNRGVNAFFIKNDLIKNHFEIKDIKDLYKPPKYGRIVNGKFVGYLPSKKQMVSV